MDGWCKGLRGGDSNSTPLSALKGRSMGPGSNGYGRQNSGGASRGLTPPVPGASTPDGASSASKQQPGRPGFRLGTPPLPQTPQSAPGKPLTSGRTPRTGPPQQLRALPEGACSAPEHHGPPDSPRGSVKSADAASTVDATDLDMEGESVQVIVRVRPHNEEEQRQQGADTSCLQPLGTRSITCWVPGREPRSFTYDQILWQTPQTDVFEVAGLPMVDHVMAGYNSSIFAYGQTGAGKTHTMLGVLSPPGEAPSDMRGLAPRVFEYLFERIGKEEDQKGREALRYSCRCSFLEIYNETITDLLNPAAHNLPIREDQRGCFVEGLSELHVQNEDDVLQLMRRGAEARHVGETRMNRESSRSHSVFTCTVEKSYKSAADGVTSVIVSRLNLIDLAGSERIYSGGMGGSQAQGTHFKEAVHINKSLTTLGRVIMELVDAQRSHARVRHIPYRDSRLTFLLQDSLGGNAKTQIIAAISPSLLCSHETLSTLQFVSRAKCIRNRAHINLDYRGDVAVLQREILRLNKELDDIRANNTEAAFAEAASLRDALIKAEKHGEELEQRLAALGAEAARYRRERARLEERLTSSQADAGRLEGLVDKLRARASAVEARMAEVAEHQAQIDEVQQAAQEALEACHADKLAALARELASAEEAVEASRSDVRALRAALAQAEAQVAKRGADAEDSARRLALTEQALADLREQLEVAQAQQATTDEARATAVAGLEATSAQLAAAQSKQADTAAALASAKAELDAARVVQEKTAAGLAATAAQLAEAQDGQAATVLELAAAREELASASAAVSQLQASLQARREELSGSQAEVARLEAQVAEVTASLSAERAAVQQAGGELDGTRGALASEAAARAAAEQRCQRLDSEVSDLAQRAADLETSLSLSRAEAAAQAAELAATAARMSELEAAVAAATERTDGLEARLADLAAQAAAAQATLQQDLGKAGEELQMERARSEQMSRERQEATQRGCGLQEELDATRCTLGTTQAALDTQAARVAALESNLADSQAALSDRTKALGDAQAELATCQAALTTEQGVTAELRAALEAAEGDVSRLEERVAGLETDVAGLQGEVVARSAELDAVRGALKEQEAASEALVASLEEAKAAAEQELARRVDELACAQQELDASQAGVESLGVEMEEAVAALREEKAGLLELVEGQAEDIVTLRADVAQVQAAADAARAEAEALTAQLTAELTDTKHQAAQARREATELSAAVSRRSEELAATQRGAREAEVAAAVAAREAADRIAALQRDLIQAQEQAVAREFELKAASSRLTAQLDAAAKEVAGLNRRLDTRGAELHAARSQIKQQADALASTQTLLAERDRELLEVRRRAAEERDAAVVSRAKDQAVINELSQELSNVRNGRGDMEAQIKTYLLANTRQNRAMQEIRRLIEWATTPPSSGRSSIGAPCVADSSPVTSAVEAALGNNGAGALRTSVSMPPPDGGAPDPMAGQAPHMAAAAAAAQALRNSAHSLAALYRLRTSLSLMAGGDPDVGGGSSHRNSPACSIVTSPMFGGKAKPGGVNGDLGTPRAKRSIEVVLGDALEVPPLSDVSPSGHDNARDQTGSR